MNTVHMAAKASKKQKKAVAGDNIIDMLTCPDNPCKFDREISHEDISVIQAVTEKIVSETKCGFLESESISQSIGASADDSIDRIRDEAQICKRCELYKTRKNLVFGEGALSAKLVFVGEAPGADEDETGIPFVGRAGRHLDNILAAVGIQRREIYICNILKCRPPGNRTPTSAEMEACTPLLKRQLELIRPEILACLGNTAVKYILGPGTPGITKIRGQWFDSIFGVPCMPMYHPSYLLRYPSREKGSPNWQMWLDIQALKKRYDEILQGRCP